MKRVDKIICNSRRDTFSVGDCGVWWDGGVVVGGPQIDEIIYHNPMGDGDRHYADIIFTDKSIKRVFDIDEMQFSYIDKP